MGIRSQEFLKNRKCYICGATDTSHWRTYVDEKGIRHKNIHVCDKCRYAKKPPEGYIRDDVDKETIYKSLRIINGRPKWVITDGNGKIVDKNPAEGQIKIAREERYKIYKCCKCGATETPKDWFGKEHWYDHLCNKMNCTKYLCKNCWHEEHRKLPDSHNNIIKGLANSRTGNLDRDSESGKSLIDQAITSNVLKIEDLNIKMNNFGYYIDMRHKKYGKIDVKGSSPRTIRAGLYKYHVYEFHTYGKIGIDTFICIGYDKNRKSVKYVWIVPNDEWVSDRDRITISDSEDSKSFILLREFLVDSKPYNDAYYSLMEFLKDKKYFGVEDLKKWLEKE